MRGRGKGSKGIVVTATRIPISFCVEFLTREANQEKFFLLACLPSLNDRFRSCLSRLFSLVYKIYKGDLLQAILWNARANDVIDSTHMRGSARMVDNASNQGKLIPLFPIPVSMSLSKYWCNTNASSVSNLAISNQRLSFDKNRQSSLYTVGKNPTFKSWGWERKSRQKSSPSLIL